MDANQLYQQIRAKKSFLCVGLDTDVRKIPLSLTSKGKHDAVFEFNKAIIDATADLCVAYKPNMAFYEVNGARGWDSLAHTVQYLREHHPEIMIIADAKRGDISNTASMYAKSMFDSMDFDAVTIAPYMGRDAVQPFLEYQGRWAVLLAVTSNESWNDFQTLDIQSAHGDKRQLFEEVLERSKHWGHEGNMMYVVGATHASMLQRVRQIVPEHFLLIPGVGHQGGSLDDVVKYGMNRRCGLLVNSARGILYADGSARFAEAARAKALELQQQMAQHLEQLG